jgi:capsular polysaccharide biosynthesis protein
MIKWARPASLVARAVRLATNEATALGLTGVAPFRDIAVEPYIVDRWPEPIPVSLDSPVNVAGPRAWIDELPAAVRYHYTAEVENGAVFANGTVLAADGGHITRATHKILDSHKRRRKLAAWGTALTPYRAMPRIAHYDQPVLTMTASNQKLYFHWLIDCLPRLLRLLKGLDPETLIYADQSRPFQRESLALAGIRADRIIDASRIPALTARHLIVPCHQFVRGWLLPEWAVGALRGLVAPARAVLPPTARGHGRRLYISRGDAAHRRVLNEEELFALLSPHGFTLLQLSHLSLAEQIVAFADAEIVVAPNGSGLANLVFSQPGTRFIELLPRSNIDALRVLCASAELDFGYLKSIACNDDTEWESLSDLNVDTGLVAEFLERSFGR